MLGQTIDSLPNTSVVTIKRLQSLGIKTYWDLLNYFPFRYEDRSIISPIFSLQEGDIITVSGTIQSMKNEYARRGMTLQKALLEDQTGKIGLTWFNQSYIATSLKPGMHVTVWGEVKKYGSLKTIIPQEYEVMKTHNAELLHLGRIVPIYSEVRGLSSKTIREKIWHVLKSINLIEEYLPKDIIQQHKLKDEFSAYRDIHFPQTNKQIKEAKHRLSFDELFEIQLATSLVKREWKLEKVGTPFKISNFNSPTGEQISNFIKSLPFQLTDSQKKVINEILHDLASEHPMNRFLQGDVGSGKTVVAAIAAYAAHLNGFQSIIMAPTEILAEQHYKTLTEMFKNTNIDIGIQTKSKKLKDQPDIAIGTHALLNSRLNFKNVGLVVVDEQHRFGVRQRALLKEKGVHPHLLTMTATPIPRTVALTIFGELDMSVIDEMPKNRLPIKSWFVPREKRQAAYNWIAQKIQKGDQAFIICPLIEESEIESMKSVKAAVKEYEHLSKNIFPHLKLGLLHGRVKPKEKEELMQQFKNGKVDILVSTSVVEVGIDIPNATIILIEGSERFGLAQLHQLRGRVGRGDKQSYCLLFSDSDLLHVERRLHFFAANINGMKLAEYDLERRGAGELYGTKQHGYTDLHIASLTDYPLIEKTKEAVEHFLENYSLDEFKLLQERIKQRNIAEIAKD